MKVELKISLESNVSTGVCRANANLTNIGCNGRLYC